LIVVTATSRATSLIVWPSTRNGSLDSQSAEGVELNAVHTASDRVLYFAEASDAGWTRRCLRQADRVLLMASSSSPPAVAAWLDADGNTWRRPLDLVLIHDGGRDARQTAESWRKQFAIELVCHIRRGNTDDIARVARLLDGTAVGLVLSGGGARGFAHLGVFRALREVGIPVDLVGGCSMGAIVGAGVALEWDPAEQRERLRRAFVESDPINDYTLPFLSLAKGQKVARRLEEHFGDTLIEDLWRPFYCVSTNLNKGNLTVHRDGKLVDALRASVSIPGLLPPVMIDGEAHIDGGVINYLPIDLMSSMCGVVIAVDVTNESFSAPLSETNAWTPFWPLSWRGKFPPIVDLLIRAATVNSDALARTMRGQANILFRPPVEGIDLLDWRACDRAIDIGYRYAMDKLEELTRSPPHRRLDASVQPGSARGMT
jgi:NTE family protein